jgi:hypothetical protein
MNTAKYLEGLEFNNALQREALSDGWREKFLPLDHTQSALMRGMSSQYKVSLKI